MAVPDKIYPLTVEPGIQRDGTTFSSKSYIDGLWCRWYRGLPQKMGGYQLITNQIDATPRGVFVLPLSPIFNIYIGTPLSLQYITVDNNGAVQGPLQSRTPISFPTSNANLWSFDVMFSTVDNGSILVAHAAPNLSSIDSLQETPVWFGDANVNTPLKPTGFTTSGGIVVLHPFLFIFGSNGNVIWTNANDPTTELGNARVTASKIVAGLPTRGGNSSPAGLLWSLDSLIRVTQVGTTAIEFAFDTVTSESSILSSQSVIEYDGVYYWAAVDRFLVYNGIVAELPNDMSLEYFFNNLNMAQRQKVWATKFAKKGEIWWFFPTGNNLECNHAIIYNIRERKWYDTPINRSDGYFDQVFSYPVWSDNVSNVGLAQPWSQLKSTTWKKTLNTAWYNWGFAANYNIWMHEIGVDQVDLQGNHTAINSFFETSILGLVTRYLDTQRQEIDRWTYIYRIEPDFVQSGNMVCEVRGQEYARSPVVSSNVTWSQQTQYTWAQLISPVVASWQQWGCYTLTPTTTKIDMREQRREMTLKFSSNTVGGYYEMGQVLLVGRIGDARQ
jgi:hypothetical protein